MPISGAWTYTTVSGTECRIDNYATASGYTVTIPTVLDTYSVISVYANALKSKNLTSLEITHEIDLDDECFGYNPGISVTIEQNVTTNGVGYYNSAPFEGCSIGSNLTLGNGITIIDDYTFCYSGLTALTLPTSLTTIRTYAFSYNSISELTMDFVVDLDDYSFAYNPGISVTVDEDVTTGGVGYYNSAPFLNCAIGNNLTIGSNTTKVNQYLFAYAGISSLSLPTSVTSLGVYCFYHNLINDFSYTSSLTTISDYALTYNSISEIEFNYVIDLGDQAIAYNPGISVTLNENITTNSVGSYGNSPLKNCQVGNNLTITNNVSNIPNYLFAYAGISSLSLPTSVTSIGIYCFYYSSITTLDLPNIYPQYQTIVLHIIQYQKYNLIISLTLVIIVLLKTME